MPGFKFRFASLQCPRPFHLITPDPAKADAAEIKVTTWAACTTGTSPVMTQGRLWALHTEPHPPGLPFTCGGCTRKSGQGVLLPYPAPASVRARGKQRRGIGVPPLPPPPPGILERLLAQPGPQLLHLQSGIMPFVSLCHVRGVGAGEQSARLGGGAWMPCHGGESPLQP